jgi:hypothetical protein
MKAKISELRARSIKMWKEEKLEEFVHSMRKRQSFDKVDQRAEEFIVSNNCTMNKAPRKRMAKLLFSNSKHDSSNLQFIPAYSRFIAIVN